MRLTLAPPRPPHPVSRVQRLRLAVVFLNTRLHRVLDEAFLCHHHPPDQLPLLQALAEAVEYPQLKIPAPLDQPRHPNYRRDRFLHRMQRRRSQIYDYITAAPCLHGRR